VTFLPWYHGPAGASANAWQAFGLIDLLLLGVALAAIAPFAGSALGLDLPRLQLSLGLLGAASCATILVAYRLLNPPGADNEGTSVAAGAWIGLLVCAAVVALAYGVSRGTDRA
jgi:hypothetical protein